MTHATLGDRARTMLTMDLSSLVKFLSRFDDLVAMKESVLMTVLVSAPFTRSSLVERENRAPCLCKDTNDNDDPLKDGVKATAEIKDKERCVRRTKFIFSICSSFFAALNLLRVW